MIGGTWGILTSGRECCCQSPLKKLNRCINNPGGILVCNRIYQEIPVHVQTSVYRCGASEGAFWKQTRARGAVTAALLIINNPEEVQHQLLLQLLGSICWDPLRLIE